MSRNIRWHYLTPATIPRAHANSAFPTLLNPLNQTRLLAAVLISAFVLGCDDPSSAGLELIDDIGAKPTIELEEPVRAESGEIRDETGSSDRILSGSVDDPLAGALAASAYLDFSEPVTPPSAFRTGPVTAVTLELVIDYVYGDTLGTGTLTLSDMTDEWPSTGVRSDTTLTPGGEIVAAAFATSDTTVVVELPMAWIDANEENLRVAGSDTLFHGFQLIASDVNAVVGFDVSSSVMRVVSGGETLSFPVSRRLSTAARTVDPSPPADRLLLQDTAGPGIVLEFDLTDNDLATAVVNRGEIHLTVDTLALAAAAPANFNRPAVERLELQALTTSASILVLETARIIDGSVTFSSDLVRAAMQGLAEDVGSVQEFRIVVDVEENGIGTVVLQGPGVDGAPVAEITYSKIQ